MILFTYIVTLPLSDAVQSLKIRWGYIYIYISIYLSIYIYIPYLLFLNRPTCISFASVVNRIASHKSGCHHVQVSTSSTLQASRWYLLSCDADRYVGRARLGPKLKLTRNGPYSSPPGPTRDTTMDRPLSAEGQACSCPSSTLHLFCLRVSMNCQQMAHDWLLVPS